MDDFQRVYEDYVNAFAFIPQDEKKKEIIKKVNEIRSVIMDLSAKVGIPAETLLPDDIQKLEESSTEDDYLRALFSHLICLEDALGKYLDKTVIV